jgi:hypothetical protein
MKISKSHAKKSKILYFISRKKTKVSCFKNFHLLGGDAM